MSLEYDCRHPILSLWLKWLMKQMIKEYMATSSYYIVGTESLRFGSAWSNNVNFAKSKMIKLFRKTFAQV